MKILLIYFEKMNYLFAMTVMAAFCGTANAQIGIENPKEATATVGPSLEESKKWIVEKINAVSYNAYLMPDENRTGGFTTDKFTFNAEFNGCQLKITKRQSWPYNGATLSAYTIRAVDVTKLNSKNMEVSGSNGRDSDVEFNEGYSRLLIWTIGRERSVLEEKKIPFDIRPDRKEKIMALFLYFKGRELAERMKNAMQHVITLCVEQTANIKAAEPQRPKETF